MTQFSREQVCQMFGCTMDQLNAQYIANYKSILSDYTKAVTTGKKVRGFSAEQLKPLVDKYAKLSRQ